MQTAINSLVAITTPIGVKDPNGWARKYPRHKSVTVQANLLNQERGIMKVLIADDHDLLRDMLVQFQKMKAENSRSRHL
jgi:hypothetical protein